MDSALWRQKIVLSVHHRIRAAGWSPIEIDRRIGWRTGTTGYVLSDESPLHVEQLLEILRVLHTSPVTFFQELEGPDDGLTEPQDRHYKNLLRLLDENVREGIEEEVKDPTNGSPPDSEPD